MNKKPKNKKYISISVYANAEQGELIKRKLGRDATSKDFVDALVEKLSNLT